MPDPRPIETTDHGLMLTDDAMIWAEEFCRIFNGKLIMSTREMPHDPGDGQFAEHWIDEGGMVGWFANAMQVAVNMYERRKLQEKDSQVEHITYRVDVGESVTSVERVDEDEETLEESFVEGFKEGRDD